MIRADKLDKIAELRLLQILNRIKKEFKEGKYHFEYPIYQEKDSPIILKLLQEDNDIEEKF